MKLRAKTNRDDLTDIFGIISVWKYKKDLVDFRCKSSFTTPEIVPFTDGSKKLHNMTYLMQSKEGKIFYFCKREDKETKLQLCILDYA